MGKIPRNVKAMFMTKTCRRMSPVLDKLFPDQPRIKGVEIGVFKGAHSYAMLRDCTRLHLTCVDMWELHAVRNNQAYTGQKEESWGRKFQDEEVGLEIKGEAIVALSQFIDKGRCRIVQEDSSVAAAMLRREGKKFDFVYIDGDHSYEGIVRDIKAWLPLLRDGGYLSGHDFHWAGVKKALEELVNESGWDFVRKTNSDGDWLVGPVSF